MRTHMLSIGLAALAIAGGALAQPALPDQGSAPPSSNPNMGDGTGAGPAGSIGDPNGPGPGAAAPKLDPRPLPPIPERTVSGRPTLSKSDAVVLKSCLAMPRERMDGVARCRALMIRNPDLFK